ncbi:hypothetical protein ACFQUU_21450 [Herbaspirillum sp. GCM10030257]|uniref:hypothetical protein n=1 Tax=Herbaspirillum sp. GCM10030257 TaxID=3273393 RepID=UPI0036181150
MPADVNLNREREFQKPERKFNQGHRYPGCEEEVAVRIVNKQRSPYHGEHPDEDAPIACIGDAA